MGKALSSGNTSQFYSLIVSKATYRRVLIGVVYIILGEGCRGNIGTVRQRLDS